MIFKLALRNLTEKPFRSVSLAIVIALTIAISFCVLSYSGAAGFYVNAVEKAETGESDIKIVYRSDGSRIIDTSALNGMMGDFEYCVGSLTVFGMIENGSYVRVRGFEKNDLEKIHSLSCVQGSVENLLERSDNVAVSESAAKALNLKIDSQISVTVMNKTKAFYVAAIASDDGYFAGDYPFTLIGINRGVTSYFNSEWGGFYSEIYIKLKNPTTADTKIEEIKALPKYSNMLVEGAVNTNAINEKTRMLSAPINIIGGAINFLAVSAIVLLFAAGAGQKRKMISRLSVIGATKGQTAAVIAVESLILGAEGAILGAALAVGALKLLLSVTLSVGLGFKISILLLLLSSLIGFAVTLISGFVPFFIARRHTDRENIVLQKGGKLKIQTIAFVVCIITVAAMLAVELILSNKTSGIIAIFVFILLLLMVVLFSPLILNAVSFVVTKAKKKNADFLIASKNVSRLSPSRRILQSMTLGLTVCSMLFVTWIFTTGLFTGFIDEFSDLILVQNVPSQQSVVDDFSSVQGVKKAVPAIWRKTKMSFQGNEMNINVLGSSQAFDTLAFEFITDESEARQKLNEVYKGGEKTAFIDKSYNILYGLNVGDTFTLTVEGNSSDFVVGGIVQQKIFTGNYIVVSESTLSAAFNLPAFDTVLIVADGVEETIGRLRSSFADKNYFIIGGLDNFKYEIEAFEDIFNLIGLLAFLITAMVAAAIVFNTTFARAQKETERTQFLIAGMSKKHLFRSEVFEHIILSVGAFLIAFLFSFPLSICLIDILKLADIYFKYTLAPLPAFICSFAFALGYIFMPFIARYKKGYSLRGKGF